MTLSRTAKYYRNNPKARAVRLKQQKRYDEGKGSTGRSAEDIKKYHRELSKFRNKNRHKKAEAVKKNGGKPVDATHRKDGSISYGDRSANRAETRKRNVPSNPHGGKGRVSKITLKGSETRK